MTVAGGTIVLSAIFAQSLMIANLPCQKLSKEYNAITTKTEPDNNTVLPDFDVVPNCGGLYNTVSTDMNVISYFHRVVVEVSTVSLVGRPVIIGWMKSFLVLK